MAGQTSSSAARGRSISPFGHRKPSYPGSSSYSSSSSSSLMGGRLIPRSSPSSVSSHYFGNGGGAGGFSRCAPPSRGRSGGGGGFDHLPRGCGDRGALGFASAEELLGDAPRSGESISVTIRFRPMSDREFQRGDEIAWYADGDKIVRSEYNPATAYAFGNALEFLILGFAALLLTLGG